MIGTSGPGGRWRLALTALVGATVVGLDQLTKQMVLDRLGPEGDLVAVRIIPGVLRFIYVENTGAAFGFFRGNSALLTVLATAVVVFMLFYFRRSIAGSSWLALALGLQIGGAFGNIVDRLQHGFVIDFIDVPYWPTFNLADSAITVGVVILGVYLFFRDVQVEPGPSSTDQSRETRAAAESSAAVSSGAELSEPS